MIPGVRKIPRRRAWHPTPVFLPGESHEQRSLVGYSPWGCKESRMTKNTHTHTHTHTVFIVESRRYCKTLTFKNVCRAL